jgi:hypothetical protein
LKHQLYTSSAVLEHRHSTLAEFNVHMISLPVVGAYRSRPNFLGSGEGFRASKSWTGFLWNVYEEVRALSAVLDLAKLDNPLRRRVSLPWRFSSCWSCS